VPREYKRENISAAATSRIVNNIEKVRVNIYVRKLENSNRQANCMQVAELRHRKWAGIARTTTSSLYHLIPY
jgi:hypothetical protein